MNWWHRYFPPRDPVESRRLQRLAAGGCTIELRELDEEDTVLLAVFGYGEEFWRVDRDYEIDPRRGEIRRGRLILENGTKLCDRERLRFLCYPIRRLTYRV